MTVCSAVLSVREAVSNVMRPLTRLPSSIKRTVRKQGPQRKAFHAEAGREAEKRRGHGGPPASRPAPGLSGNCDHERRVRARVAFVTAVSSQSEPREARVHRGI